MKITFFDSGNTMAFEDNEQVSVAQKSWLIVFAEYLESCKIDPTKQGFILPDGKEIQIFKTEDNCFNWIIRSE